MTKKKSYVQLLKEAIAEFDTSDSVQVKGPMLDPILSWRGDGELPTNKDAASILERYYFNENEDKPLESDYENDKGDAEGEAMEHAEGTGTEQAGTSDSDTIKGALDDKEEIIAKEWIEGMIREENEDDTEEDENNEPVEEGMAGAVLGGAAGSAVGAPVVGAAAGHLAQKKMFQKENLFFLEQDHDEDKETAEDEAAESEETQDKEKEEGTEKHDVKESLFFEQDENDEEGEEEDEEDEEATDEKVTENAIIEKIIGEMEEENGIMTYTDDEPKVGWPDEKEAKGPMDHAEGSGTEQAGTGDAEGQIPDRDDIADDLVEPKKYTDESLNIEQALEQLELNLLEQDDEGDESEEEEEDEESKKKLDVDKEVAKEQSSVPGGPSPKKLGEDWEDDEKYYSEGFKIFKEEIENDDLEVDKIEKISSKRIRV